ncbi:MBL fold metallo-hydrolase [Ramlibacter sp. PS3R-8]|uniref:MBL fold metallo-hydrolase n=1 Tax=Ramlibacter sp. PS3R-8 TaxID=3133437 RepID=UPI0030A08E2E
MSGQASPPAMRLTFIGSGDAFGSGGRLNTCFHVQGENVNFLIDCGASSLIGLKARAVDRNAIQAIFITHFHADHFGGIPFFMLDAQFFSRRTEPLTIVGPRGLREWYERVMETSFPGSSKTLPKFALHLQELDPGDEVQVAGVTVRAFQAHHGNPGGPFFSYRLAAEGRTVAYTGDTEWTEQLVDAAQGVDLFVAEAYFYDKKVKLHLDLATLLDHLPRIQPKRLVLTHMSDEMLLRVPGLPYETASDGLVVEF